MKRPAFAQHAHRLKRAGIIIVSLGALYAIWTSLGFPAFPIALGDAPSASEAPFVVQVDIPTAAHAPPAKHLRRTRLARISQHVAVHSTGSAARTTPVTVTPVRVHRVASADVTATAPNSPVVPPPPIETQPITITLPPAPQLPPLPLPQITALPVAPALPGVPALPQLPLPPLP